MTGQHKEMAKILGVTLVFDIGLLFLLVPNWGVIGAAVATSLTIITRNIIMVVRVWHHLKINSTVFSLRAWGLGVS